MSQGTPVHEYLGYGFGGAFLTTFGASAFYAVTTREALISPLEPLTTLTAAQEGIVATLAASTTLAGLLALALLFRKR